jgi:hypothetical protein
MCWPTPALCPPITTCLPSSTTAGALSTPCACPCRRPACYCAASTPPGEPDASVSTCSNSTPRPPFRPRAPYSAGCVRPD